MLRGSEELFRARHFNEFTLIEHRDAIRELTNDREVVTDKEKSYSEPRAQIVEQSEDLGSNADVQRTDGLIQDQDSRIGGHRPGDGYALLLTTAE